MRRKEVNCKNIIDLSPPAKGIDTPGNLRRADMVSSYYEGSGGIAPVKFCPRREVWVCAYAPIRHPILERFSTGSATSKRANVFYIKINILSDSNFDSLKIDTECLISPNSVDLYISRPARGSTWAWH